MFRTNEENKFHEQKEYINILEAFVYNLYNEMDMILEKSDNVKVTTGDKAAYKKKYLAAIKKVSSGRTTKISDLSTSEEKKVFNILDRSHVSDKEQRGIREDNSITATDGLNLLSEEFKGFEYRGAYDSMIKEVELLREEAKTLLENISYRGKYRSLLKEHRVSEPSELTVRGQIFFYKKLRKDFI